MSERSDPPRLRTPGAGASASARVLLESGHAEQPSADQLARLAQRLPHLGGGASAPRPAVATGGGASIVPGALIGASLALVLVGGAWLRDAVGPASGPALQVSTAPSVAPPLVPPAGDVPATGSPSLPPAVAPGTPDPAPTPAPPPSLASPARTGAPSARPAIPGAQAGALVVPSGGSPSGGGAPSPGDTEAEIDLLRRAQQALPHRPAEALAAAEEHGRRFPGGALSQEREVITISALVALGRRDEAQRRATRFGESYPRSAHRAGIEELVRAPAGHDRAVPAPPQNPPGGRLDQNGAREGTPTP